MKPNSRLTNSIHLAGTICFIAGALDPLEGSVVILLGAILLATANYFQKNMHAIWFITIACMITIGVGFMFYFSSLGGFGGNSTLSWWWGTLILPYPLGWLAGIGLLIHKAMKKN